MKCVRCKKEKSEEFFKQKDTNKILKMCITCRESQNCPHGKRKSRCEECKNICKHGNIKGECMDCEQMGPCEHNRRKRDCKLCGGVNICPHEKLKFNCLICNKNKACIHGINGYDCVECEGGGICIHKRRKRFCTECEGASLCIHNRQRRHCTECEGDHVCEHKKIKRACVDCNGVDTCEHKKVRYVCKECKGGGICTHNRVKYECRLCYPSAFCEHGRREDLCVKCEGKGICEHKKIKCLCVECDGVSLCSHEKRKDQCKDCKTAYCKHGSWPQCCTKCHPEKSCQECKDVFIRKTTRFYPLCAACFFMKYPDDKEARQIRVKERYFISKMKEAFPDEEMSFNKTIPGGYSQKRPDVFIDKGDYCIGIENDENRHESETSLQRNRRNLQIWEDIDCRPLVMIRFNPDVYTEEDEKFDSCFKFEKGKITVNKNEWKKRFTVLESVLQKYLDNKPTENLTEIYLFY